MKFIGHQGERSGVRGGRDQFKWDDVKHDKFKENYIGHSIHAARPTFNDPKPNALWYLDSKNPSEEKTELNRLKDLEQEMMMEALGLKPKTHNPHRELTKEDMVIMLKRSETAVAADANAEDATLGHGMTFSSTANGKFAEAPQRLPGVFDAAPTSSQASSVATSDYKQLTKAQRRAMPPAQLAELKAAHSAAKKARKAEKKRAKKQRRSSVSSSSSSSEQETKGVADRGRHDSDDDAPQQREHVDTHSTARTRARHDSEDDELAPTRSRTHDGDDDSDARRSRARRRHDSEDDERAQTRARSHRRHDSEGDERRRSHDNSRHARARSRSRSPPRTRTTRHDSPDRRHEPRRSPSPVRDRGNRDDDAHRYQSRYRV